MWDDLAAIDHRFAYHGERTRYIAFPLGGIGAGGFSISGSGRLIDWSIRNRPALQGYNGYSHFAIKAEKGGELVDARVLNGPYDLNPSGAPGLRKMFDGFGHGANRQTLAGVPHFREVDFYGRFPTADLVFRDARFPGGVRLTAFSPFIPHNDRDSSHAGRDVRVRDRQQHRATTLDLHPRRHARELRRQQRRATPSPQDGGIASLHLDLLRHRPAADRSAAISPSPPTRRRSSTPTTTTAASGSTTSPSSGRSSPGPARCRPRHYDEPRALPPHEPAARARHPRRPRHRPRRRAARRSASSSPGASRDGDIYWAFRSKPDGADPRQADPDLAQLLRHRSGPTPLASAREALTRWDDAQGRAPSPSATASSAPPCRPRSSTPPARRSRCCAPPPSSASKAASSGPGRASTPRTAPARAPAPTSGTTSRRCRTSSRRSSARSARPSSPTTSSRPAASPSARSCRSAPASTSSAPAPTATSAPSSRPTATGSSPATPTGSAASGRSVKRAIEYAWSPENPDRWDPDETGILSGRQHQTLDMELFEPNSWLGSMYVAALLAAAEMAAAMGDTALAEKMRAPGPRRRRLHRRRALQRPLVRPEDRPLRQGRARPLRHRPQRRRARRRLHGDLLVRRVRRAQVPDGRGLHLRPDPRPVARRGRRPRRLPRRGQGPHRAQGRPRQQLPPRPLRPLQPLPQLRLRARGRPADRHLPRGHPPADGRRPLRRGGLDRHRVHVRLAHDHARPRRRRPRGRPRRPRPPRRHAAATPGTTSNAAPTTPAPCPPGSSSTPSPACRPTSSPAASPSRPKAKGDYRLFWSAGTAFGTPHPHRRQARARRPRRHASAVEVAVDGRPRPPPRPPARGRRSRADLEP